MRRVVQAAALWTLLLATGVWALEDDPPSDTLAAPFRVSGTIVAPPTKIALVVILDEQGKATGELKLHEGDVIQGYRVARIDPQEVVFERDGRTVTVKVGNEQEPRAVVAPSLVPVIPYDRKKPRPIDIVPPPDNIEEVRRQTDEFIRQLGNNPEFQKGIGEIKRRFLERSADPESKP